MEASLVPYPSTPSFLFSLFVSAETIVDYKPEVLLAGLVWEKNTVAAYNPRSYKPKRTGWKSLFAIIQDCHCSWSHVCWMFYGLEYLSLYSRIHGRLIFQLYVLLYIWFVSDVSALFPFAEHTSTNTTLWMGSLIFCGHYILHSSHLVLWKIEGIIALGTANILTGCLDPFIWRNWNLLNKLCYLA